MPTQFQVITLLSLISLALGIGLVNADMFSPSHSCSKPYKPYSFTSRWELEEYKDSIERYKSCIEEFVEEQEEAIRHHQNAAQEAIDEWNRFARYELNY